MIMMLIYFSSVNDVLLNILMSLGFYFFSFDSLILILLILLLKLFSSPFYFFSWFSSSGGQLDFLCYSFMIFTIVMMFFMWLSMCHFSCPSFNKTLKFFCLGLLFTMMNFFNEQNLLFFYIYYELGLVPMFLIVLVFGYQPERLEASLALLFYTVTASFPLLFVFILLKSELDYTTFSLLSWGGLIEGGMDHYLALPLFLSFLVKLPMYPFHLWLPKAHVEAPFYGSMLLASVMLKMGSYGLLRLFFLYNFISFNLIILGVSIFSCVLVGLLCTFENDMKIIIAYSSVGHMGVMLGSFVSLMKWGGLSLIMISISHGVSSSALFLGAYYIYLRSNSRSLLISSMMSNWSVSMKVYWFFLVLLCMSCPPTFNFFAEVLSLVTLINISKSLSIFLFFVIMLCGAYSILLYINVFHSQKPSLSVTRPLDLVENLLMKVHIWYGLSLIVFFNFI